MSNVKKKICERTICSKYVSESLKQATIYNKVIKFHIEKMKLEKIRSQDKTLSKEYRTKAKLNYKNLKSQKKDLPKYQELNKNNNYTKKLMKECKKIYCNPKCNGTKFENVNTRKKRFEKTPYILIDNAFNGEIPLNKISKLKKNGALSACLNENYIQNYDLDNR